MKIARTAALAALAIGSFSLPAFAQENTDPCAYAKNVAPTLGYTNAVNCYLGQAIAAAKLEREKMVSETHHSREDSKAKWDAVEQLDQFMERIQRTKIAEGSSIDSRKGDGKVAAVE